MPVIPASKQIYRRCDSCGDYVGINTTVSGQTNDDSLMSKEDKFLCQKCYEGNDAGI